MEWSVRLPAGASGHNAELCRVLQKRIDAERPRPLLEAAAVYRRGRVYGRAAELHRVVGL